jgi:hypothetical protein
MSVAAPEACVDVMLGAIALFSRTRTLDEYVDNDMVECGQTFKRQRVRSKLVPRSELLPSYTWADHGRVQS